MRFAAERTHGNATQSTAKRRWIKTPQQTPFSVHTGRRTRRRDTTDRDARQDTIRCSLKSACARRRQGYPSSDINPRPCLEHTQLCARITPDQRETTTRWRLRFLAHLSHAVEKYGQVHVEIELRWTNLPPDSVAVPAVVHADRQVPPDVVLTEKRRSYRPPPPRSCSFGSAHQRNAGDRSRYCRSHFRVWCVTL